MFYSSDDDEEEVEEEEEKDVEVEKKIFIRKELRKRTNPFELPASKFVQYFRLSKKAFQYVLDEINGKIKPVRSTAVPNALKLAITLRILVEGSYQHGAGNDFNVMLAQPTVSKIFKEILDILETHVYPKWVKLDMSEDEKAEAKLYFSERTRFPGVIGCVGGTHIKIITPGKDDRRKYYNQNGFYSLNAMIVCDHKMRIRYVNAEHPGASHDSLVWNSSEIRAHFDNRFHAGERNTWLLGDAHYPLEPFLISPFRATQVGSPQSSFNEIHARARSTIDRTIAIFKNRFRCVLGDRQVHYRPQKAKQIANVCAALHNICIHFNSANDLYEMPNILNESANGVDVDVDNLKNVTDNAKAIEIRNQIMDSFMNKKSTSIL